MRNNVTFVLKISDILDPNEVNYMNRLEAKFQELAVDMSNNVRGTFPKEPISWDFSSKDDDFYWVVYVEAHVEDIKKADNELKLWAKTQPVVAGSYIEHIFSNDEKTRIYVHLRNRFLELPMEELVSYLVPDTPWEPSSYAPYRRTFSTTGGFSDDWVEQQKSWKPIIAMHVLEEERYDDFVNYISSTTQNDISGLPKTWVLKSFKIGEYAFTTDSNSETNYQKAWYAVAHSRKYYDQNRDVIRHFNR